MTTFFFPVYEQEITNQQVVILNHGLGIRQADIRFIESGGVTTGASVLRVVPDEDDPYNILTVYLSQPITGKIQLLRGDETPITGVGLEYQKHIKPLAGDEFITVISGTDTISLQTDNLVNELTTTSGVLQTQITINTLTSAGGAIAVSEPISTTTSTDFQEKLNLTVDTSTVTTGTLDQYRLIWYYEWGYSSAAAEFNSRIQIDDVDTVGEINWRPAATDETTYAASSGYIDMTLSSGTHSFDIDYRSTSAGKTARIQKARLSLSRVSLFEGYAAPPQRGI